LIARQERLARSSPPSQPDLALAAIRLKLRAIFLFNGGDARDECPYMTRSE
jgi:hypothetical protein